jgi:hypothetical protein
LETTSIEVDEKQYFVVVEDNLYKARSFAWKTKHRVKRGFPLRHGARKKRVGCSVLALPPSGDMSLSSTPLLMNNLPQCVQTCVRLFNFPFKRPLNLVQTIWRKDIM